MDEGLQRQEDARLWELFDGNEGAIAAYKRSLRASDVAAEEDSHFSLLRKPGKGPGASFSKQGVASAASSAKSTARK